MTNELDSLADEIRNCRRCPLWKSRDEAVPGEGPSSASCMLIGESPGKEENNTGRPFVGRSGDFLNKSLEKSGLRRKDFFITGSVKCHPPQNRDPKAEELESCRPYLDRQIKIIAPHILVLLGRIATKGFLGRNKVTDIRGRVVKENDRLLLATFHPAAAMRFPSRRKPFLEDMETLSSLLEERDLKGASL